MFRETCLSAEKPRHASNKMNNQEKKAYLIGGGIASLAAAVYLIKDGGLKGENISIVDTGKDMGGSLDGKQIENGAYLKRGTRLLVDKIYNCTFDLMSIIPLDRESGKTLLDDFNEFNNDFKIDAKARLVSEKKPVTSSDLGLSIADRINLLKLIILPESAFENSKIEDNFSDSFFKSNYWLQACTALAFEPWHSAAELRRYGLRFIQEVRGTKSMSFLKFMRYDEYDSLVLPIVNWLKEKGVSFVSNTLVTEIEFVKDSEAERVDQIHVVNNGNSAVYTVGTDDLVFFTNGSMTSDHSLGDNDNAPKIITNESSGLWSVWKKIAKEHPNFGKPEVFCENIDKTKWVSFSVTFKDPLFIDRMTKLSGNVPGSGGVVTAKDSNWLLSFIIPNQPHFKDQPEGTFVVWGYGLYPDKIGNYIQKKMSDCSGKEILTELCNHLGFEDIIDDMLKNAECVPCMMPYITSQFMPRIIGDRPDVIPKNTKNFAFIGQFCEMPNDMVFTVEYSVRSAITAVYGLLNIRKKVPSIYEGYKDPQVIKDFLRFILTSSV